MKRFILITSVLISAQACARGATETPSTVRTSTPLSPTLANAELTETPHKPPSRTPSPTQDEVTLPTTVRFVSNDEFSIAYESGDITQLGSVKGIVILDSDTLVVEEPNFSIDLVNWEGLREQLLRITYIGEGEFGKFGLEVEAIQSLSTALSIGVSDFFELKELYVIDTESNVSWGLIFDCIERVFHGIDTSLGANYLAFRCAENSDTWFLISINDPLELHMIMIPKSVENPRTLRPIWVEDNLLLFRMRSPRGLCISQGPEWDARCWELPYWLGRMSNEGRHLEVRIGQFEMFPEEVGFVSIECLSLNIEPCDPSVRNSWLPPSDFGRLFLDQSVWLQGGQGLLFNFLLDTDGSNNEPEETEIYILEVDSMEIRKVGHYNQVLEFHNPPTSTAPPMWSPDGEWIAVSSFDGNHYLLSIRTGELQLFAEGGFLLGPLELNQ